MEGRRCICLAKERRGKGWYRLGSGEGGDGGVEGELLARKSAFLSFLFKEGG